MLSEMLFFDLPFFNGISLLPERLHRLLGKSHRFFGHRHGLLRRLKIETRLFGLLGSLELDHWNSPSVGPGGPLPLPGGLDAGAMGSGGVEVSDDDPMASGPIAAGVSA